LIAHDTNTPSGNPCKPYYNIFRKFLMNFKKSIGINNSFYHLPHIVRMVGIVWDNVIKALSCFVFVLVIWNTRCIFFAILRNIAQQFFYIVNAFYFIGTRKMGYTAFLAMGSGTSQLLCGHIFLRNRLHDVW